LLEEPTPGRVKLVAAFFYGNNIPVQIACRFLTYVMANCPFRQLTI
jgi:hypothetical protein